MNTQGKNLHHPGAPRSGCRAGKVSAAFTLLEMLVALSAFVVLMGGIFSLAQGTMELSNDLAFAQDRSAIRQNFISFLRRSFRNLPGDAEVRLFVQQRGGGYAATLNFVNGGTSFTPGASLAPDTSVDLFTEDRPGGYMRIGIRLLDEKQTRALRAGQSVRFSKTQDTIPLLDNVNRFEWRFYNGSTNRWENNWKDARRPLMAELNLELDDGFQTRVIFWVPPVLPNVIATSGNLGLPGNQDPNNLNDPNNPNPGNPPNNNNNNQPPFTNPPGQGNPMGGGIVPGNPPRP